MKEDISKKTDKAEFNSVRDLPYVMMCAHKDYLETTNVIGNESTVTFDRFLSNYNNAGRPGGGDGELDLTTGIFTCLTPGLYTIALSGVAELGPGDQNMFWLFHNGQKVVESRWEQWTYSNTIGSAFYTQGSRTVVRSFPANHDPRSCTSAWGTLWT